MYILHWLYYGSVCVSTSLVPSLSLSLTLSYHFLTVKTHGRLLAGLDEERVRNLSPRLERTVDPERPSAPHLLRASLGDRVSHTLCRPQPRAVVGDVKCTLFVEVLVTSCE